MSEEKTTPDEKTTSDEAGSPEAAVDVVRELTGHS